VDFGTHDIEPQSRVRELGGESIDAQEIPGVGRYSQCSDSERNPFNQGSGE
jgi:predicted enzyme related to lactoylglutathione lyase